MKKIYLITILTSIFVITVIVGIYNIFLKKDFTNRQIKVGFIYVGDDSTSYTGNFIKAQKDIDDKLEAIADDKYSQMLEDIQQALDEEKDALQQDFDQL